jgi:hypothetical protein
MTHPLAPQDITLDYARQLAQQLNTVTTEPAHVIDNDGHYILVAEHQLADGWWERAQVVYTADAAHVAAG